MKKFMVLFSLMLMGCSSISLVENWKNPDIVLFNANKVLIVGMAQDKNNRESFETKLQHEFSESGVVKSISRWDDHQSRFNDDYLEHQGIYYDDNYYEKFTVYHAETTLYCICEGKERAMIWRGIIEITEPNNIEKAIKDYVKLVIIAMEDQDLVFTSQIE